ncbi:hypothetical protein EZV62_001759 [Acer yangbiense]|uniref:CCHC-type domain-containing protein n=1 Tax=Acer yangbiense TaxID=1000413 RepID=A0A5C7IV30_9ROSI|nr:hypothetical protein EZV62_001759 [Acer yangbiense]
MSAADLAGLCENLSLADEDGALLEVIEEAELEGEEDVDRSLVGRVLSGKKVNREAFKSLIDQLWNPFGNVEIELARGPWHFGRSLIVLEKPMGFRDVSKLGFNKAEFWVQIHDIPIMCMNRRTAKWLAEQIGAVVELPADSRECWGRFMRVKVLIDISRPLKRWLRLKLSKSDEIAVVGLKYERLPDFCYACGRVGHVLKECTDEEAKQGALDGSPTKYGQWLKAPGVEKEKSRFQAQISGSSSERDKSQERKFDLSSDRSHNVRTGSLTSQNGESASAALVVKEVAKVRYPETLIPDEKSGPLQVEKMIIDGPTSGPEKGPIIVDSVMPEADSGPLKNLKTTLSEKPGVCVVTNQPKTNVQTTKVEAPISAKKLEVTSTPKKKVSRRWKRAAIGGDLNQLVGKVTSPL